MGNKSDWVRVNVILYPEHITLLDKLTKITGKNRSEILREFLNEAAPAFENLLSAYDRLAALQQKERETMFDAVQEIQLELKNLGLQTIDKFNKLATN